MRQITKVALGIISAGNVLVGVGYLVCAYSPYFSPVSHPVKACLGLFFPIFIILNLCFLLFWLVCKRKYAAIPLLFFALGWGSLRDYCPFGFSREAEEGTVIKLLTYNVQGFHAEGKEEENPILQYLSGSDADIICLQEYRPGYKSSEGEIKAAMKCYPYCEITHLGGGNGLACFSRFPILSADPIPYHSLYNGSVLYRLKIGADTIILVNNHLESNKLDNNDKEKYNKLLSLPEEEKIASDGKYLLRKLADAVSIRAPQADSVAAAIRRNESPYLLACGDFNDSPISYAHRIIGKGLTDVYAKAGRGPGFTYNQNHFYFRIDHLFAGSGFHVLRCKVDRSIKASDHYPVWCLLEKQ